HRLRLADPLLHAAAVPAREGRTNRLRDGRRATRARRGPGRVRGGVPGAAGADERGMSWPLTVDRWPLRMLTPWPPARTGVAHYATMIVPALRKHLDVEVIDGQRPTANGQRIYQLGNNPHHAWIYEEAMRVPGVVVLHDVILHHLIVEMTLAKGDVEGYVEALRANHGEVGAAWARGRAAGLHSEMGNFLMPASI